MAMSFPQHFQDFLTKYQINPDIYSIRTIPRYICITPGEGLSIEDLRQDLNCEVIDVSDVCPNFYKLESHVSICGNSKLYNQGRIIAMDISSGLTVHLLDLSPSDHFLDLCCAPGSKLILAALLIGRNNDFISGGSVSGVDISSHRLATCRSMIKKYRLPRARLFCTDGASFDERTVNFCLEGAKSTSTSRSTKFHETTVYRKRPCLQNPTGLYDKVLVDAQCTHDGSIKHISKHQLNNWKDYDWDQFNPENLDKLHNLQYRLLCNGFRLLKPGGILVYSTCSLSMDQNEGIVGRFLGSHGDQVELFPFTINNRSCNGESWFRFDPTKYDGSGFFIFRVKKKL